MKKVLSVNKIQLLASNVGTIGTCVSKWIKIGVPCKAACMRELCEGWLVYICTGGPPLLIMISTINIVTVHCTQILSNTVSIGNFYSLLSSTAAFYLQRCVVEMRRIEISWSDDIGLCLIYGYSEDLAKIHLTGTHFRTWLDLICLSRKKFKNTTTPGPFDANLFPKFDLNGVI